MNPKLKEKYDNLKQYLRELGSVAVAFSGGTDSTFLLRAAREALGERAAAVTVQSDLFPRRELEEARAFCEAEGIRHLICQAKELEIEGFAQNPPDRCYICKKDLFGKILAAAAENGIRWVAEGSNLDDEGDYRPGMRAIAELGVKSPLRRARLTKAEIRDISRELGLPTWEKPSFACLASRFVYGETITAEKLSMVDRAEQLLLELGFHQFRVRVHGNLARIEVLPEEMGRLFLPEVSSRITAQLRQYGFAYVTADLAGYRTGSMNEVLPEAALYTARE